MQFKTLMTSLRLEEATFPPSKVSLDVELIIFNGFCAVFNDLIKLLQMLVTGGLVLVTGRQFFSSLTWQYSYGLVVHSQRIFVLVQTKKLISLVFQIVGLCQRVICLS